MACFARQFIAVIICLLWAIPGFSDTRQSDISIPAESAVLSAMLQEFSDLSGVPGVSLTVMQDGAVIFDQAIGQADLEQGVAISGDTVMRIGSISKSMTAVAAVRLNSAGRLDLDRPLGGYLEGFSGPARTATARQLASHLSGVRGYAEEEYISHTHYPSPREALVRFANDPLESTPGESFLYTSAGFTLLSAVMAAADNRSFEDVMREQVWSPLSLNSTGLDDVLKIVPHRGRYYVKSQDGVLENGPQVDNSFKWSGGGMQSSTHDLARFGAAVIGDGFLTPQEKALLFTPARLNDGSLSAYGLGWYVNMRKFLDDRRDRIPPELYDRLIIQLEGHHLIWHSGTAVGSVALLMMEPARGLVLAVAVNLGGVEKEMIVFGLDLISVLGGTD